MVSFLCSLVLWLVLHPHIQNQPACGAAGLSALISCWQSETSSSSKFSSQKKQEWLENYPDI